MVASLLLLAAVLTVSCSHKKKSPAAQQGVDYSTVSTPEFCADSAYRYVEE